MFIKTKIWTNDYYDFEYEKHSEIYLNVNHIMWFEEMHEVQQITDINNKYTFKNYEVRPIRLINGESYVVLEKDFERLITEGMDDDTLKELYL